MNGVRIIAVQAGEHNPLPTDRLVNCPPKSLGLGPQGGDLNVEKTNRKQFDGLGRVTAGYGVINVRVGKETKTYPQLAQMSNNNY